MAQPKRKPDISPGKIGLAVDSIADGAKILARMGFDITNEVEVLLRAIRNQIILQSYDCINLDDILRNAQTIGDSVVSKKISKEPEVIQGTAETNPVNPREDTH